MVVGQFYLYLLYFSIDALQVILAIVILVVRGIVSINVLQVILEMLILVVIGIVSIDVLQIILEMLILVVKDIVQCLGKGEVVRRMREGFGIWDSYIE